VIIPLILICERRLGDPRVTFIPTQSIYERAPVSLTVFTLRLRSLRLRYFLFVTRNARNHIASNLTNLKILWQPSNEYPSILGSNLFLSRLYLDCIVHVIPQVSKISFSNRRGIWREHSSKKWIRPRFSVDLIKGLQMSRAKPKLTQIFHLSSGVPLTFFLGPIFVGIVGRRP
jgi:hypothetical protein